MGTASSEGKKRRNSKRKPVGEDSSRRKILGRDKEITKRAERLWLWYRTTEEKSEESM